MTKVQMRDKNRPNGVVKWRKGGKNVGQSNKISYQKNWPLNLTTWDTKWAKRDAKWTVTEFGGVMGFLPFCLQKARSRSFVAANSSYLLIRSHSWVFKLVYSAFVSWLKIFQTHPWRWMQRQQKRLKGKGDDKRARETERGGERGNQLKRVSLLLSSNLISCGSQCSAVQREGHNGSHLPSIITLLESSAMCSGWMITCPPHLASLHYNLCCSFVPQCRINAANAVEPPLCIHVVKNTGWWLQPSCGDGSLHELLMLWDWVP